MATAVLVHALLIAAILVASLVSVLAPIKLFDILTDESRTRLLTRSSSKRSTSRADRVALSISALSCFAGGTFLAVVLLHLLPDAHEQLEIVESRGVWSTSYPIVEALALAGFALVYAIETMSNTCFGTAPHPQTLVTRDAAILSRHRRRTTSGQTIEEDQCTIHAGGHEAASLATTASVLTIASTTPSVEPPIVVHSENRRALVARTFTFLLALVLHSSVEGFSFGVQRPRTVLPLFVGIIVHRTIMSFSVGTRLINCHPRERRLVVGCALLFALSSPFFATIGLVLQTSAIDLLLKAQLSMVLISLSCGSIISITFFELLVPERTSGNGEIVKFVATLAGMVVIGGAILL